jgi:putative DNA primase/helicase
MMIDALSQFRDAIHAAGLNPPDVIEPGKLQRFPGVGKCNDNTAGWCWLFDDGLGGCFGDWSSGFSENWQANRGKTFSQTERAEFLERVNEARAKAETDHQQQYLNAAEKAATIWNAAESAPDDHPYLVHKNIRAYGLRLYKEALVIPVCSDGVLFSLQFIAIDGSKRFLSGGRVSDGYFCIGTIQDAKAICIAEGFATGATIHQATGCPVAIAFNARNLESVAKAMRQRLPDIPMIICADDDATTDGNPGITKANMAARVAGAKVAVPVFGDQRPGDATDFNDMAALVGLEAVAKAINTATQPDHEPVITGFRWPDPLPLMAKIEAKPYPLDALPDTLRAAVEEVRAFTKAPMPLVASSALAALSLSVQAHADVKRAEKLSGPVGLFLLTIADSGERKSTCDGFFMQAIHDYEANQSEVAKPVIKDHRASLEAWEAKRGGIKEKIRSLSKTGKSTHEQEATLRDLEHDKPKPPRVPRLIYGDATPEALRWNLAKGWPSGGVVSSEAGLVFGAHGMGKDSVMRNLATLNQLWDGADIATERRTSESFTVRGARLTIALQVQEATLRSFFDRSGMLARGTGFLARFLVAWPESTQGNRPFTEPPETWPALAKFNQRIATILDQDILIDDDGALSPPIFPLTADTKAAWVLFHDVIESELRSGGELYDVRDVASKTADNAARIATLFQLFEYGVGGAVGLAAFEGASRIAAWHLHEARRFYGELALPEEQADAVRLDSWLLDYCKRGKTNIIPRREVQRNVTPGHLRRKAALDIALVELVEAERVRLVQEGRRKEIHVNPALLNVDKQ